MNDYIFRWKNFTDFKICDNLTDTQKKQIEEQIYNYLNSKHIVSHIITIYPATNMALKVAEKVKKNYISHTIFFSVEYYNNLEICSFSPFNSNPIKPIENCLYYSMCKCCQNYLSCVRSEPKYATIICAMEEIGG